MIFCHCTLYCFDITFQCKRSQNSIWTFHTLFISRNIFQPLEQRSDLQKRPHEIIKFKCKFKNILTQLLHLSINGNDYWQSNRINIVLLLSQLLKQDMIMDIWYCDKDFKFLSFHGPDIIHERTWTTLQIYTVFNCVHFPLQSRCTVYIFYHIQSNVEITLKKL